MASARQLVGADDRGAEPHESVHGGRVGSARSRWTRFLARFGSGTFSKYQAGSSRAASPPPMEANSSLLPLSTGRPSTADQNAATFSTSSQSTAMLPILAAMAASPLPRAVSYRSISDMSA
jgi:hypothetical protein